MIEAPSTDDIILDRAIRGTDCRRCVEWACGLLANGIDSDFVCRLSGQLPPFDQVSIAELRDRTLNELGFDDLTNDSLIAHATANSLRQHLEDAERLWQTIIAAKDLWVTRQIDRLYPLFLLYHALNELDCFSEQHYLNDFTSENRDERTRQIVSILH